MVTLVVGRVRLFSVSSLFVRSAGSRRFLTGTLSSILIIVA